MITALAVAFAACKKEDKATIATNIIVPVISSPTTGTNLVVTAADSGQNLAFTWSKANYGVTAVLSYFVQVDSAGTNFRKSIIFPAAGADTLKMTNGSFNTRLMSGLGLAINAVSSIDVRIGVSLAGKDTVYSKPVTMVVTTFKVLAPPQLYVPGSYQNWSPSTAPLIYPVTTFAYEGFVYMSTSGNYFKFTSAPDWNHINYGDGGNGTLTTNGLAGSEAASSAGYYKLNADIKNLTWSAALIKTFGAIGTATPQGWNGSTPLTFNTSTNLWSATINLVPGAIKFRANDAWDINYGPADVNALTGTLVQTNNAVTITTAGSYTVTMDMSQSTPGVYKYAIVKN